MTDRSMNLLKGTLDVLVLKTLSWGPLHGYAVSRSIHRMTDEALRIEEGALYPALRRLEGKGWLASHWAETDTGRDARFYRLTEQGREHLGQEVDAWQRYVDAMSRVLFSEQPEPAR